MTTDASNNPFAPPASTLIAPRDTGAAPSVEEVLARGYDFSIGALIKEAWQKVSGIKGMVLVGFIIYIVVTQALSFVLGMILGLGFAATGGDISSSPALLLQVIVGIVAGAVGFPFMAGINMLGIRRAAGQPVSFNEMFSHFGLFAQLLVTGLLVLLLTYLGMFLLILPGIYLSIAYMLAIPLAVERKLSPWQAMEASRKAISQHWFKVFGLFVVLALILMVSMIPLGIGLIWSLPLTIVSLGVLYRTIFGVLPLPS